MELEKEVEVDEEGLTRFMALIQGFSVRHQQLFLSLYIVYGDELLFLFHTLRGHRITFPHSRMFAKAAKTVAAPEKKFKRVVGTGESRGLDGKKLTAKVDTSKRGVQLKREMVEQYTVINENEPVLSEHGEKLAFPLLHKGRRVLYNDKLYLVKSPLLRVGRVQFVLLKELIL